MGGEGRPWLTLLIVIVTVAALMGQAQDPQKAAPPGEAASIRFVDDTAASGLVFEHFNGARGQFYFPEIAGAGGGLLDYDGDGDLDVYLANGSSLPKPDPARDPTARLFQNDGTGTFSDATAAVRESVKGLFGKGVAVGDYDNDGDPDLYLTGFNESRLLENQGNGSFADVTAEAVVANRGHWASSAGFFDYDRDGRLDLLVCNYVIFDTNTNTVCEGEGGMQTSASSDTRFRSYCHPNVYEPDASILYHNNGDGTFSDVSQTSGIGKSKGNGLGVAFADFDRDGWPDVFVANDSTPDHLFRNNGDGTFTEMGFLAGLAYDENGKPRAGMGTDFGDYDGDGNFDLLVTNFAEEGNALFRNLGDGSFDEVTFESGILTGSYLNVGFGIGFFDADNDGDLDVFSVNGHVVPRISELRDDFTFAQGKLLYINHNGRFQERSKQSGSGFAKLDVGRGALFGDIDNDGDLDLLVTTNGGKTRLLRNKTGQKKNWLILKLVGTQSNRDAIGTLVRARVGKRWVTSQVQRAGSYLTSRDPRVHLGLDSAVEVDELELRWPSGIQQKLTKLPANRIMTIREKQESEGPPGL